MNRSLLGSLSSRIALAPQVQEAKKIALDEDCSPTRFTHHGVGQHEVSQHKIERGKYISSKKVVTEPKGAQSQNKVKVVEAI